MKPLPENYRLTRSKHPQLNTTAADGNNGAFIIPHHRIADYQYTVVISDRGGWEHVSVTLSSGKRTVKRCPTWEEMCFIKNLFFEPTDCVVQFHPPESEWISNHEYCLHLWKYTDREFPQPPAVMVGINIIKQSL